MKNDSIFAVQFKRAISSVGSEHLVYTQRVGGSNPSSPTRKSRNESFCFFISQKCQKRSFCKHLGNKKAICDHRERIMLFLVALTPSGITEGNPRNHLVLTMSFKSEAFVSIWETKKLSVTIGSGLCFSL